MDGPDSANMPRSVVLQKSVRCARCQLPPRWCVCRGLRTVECPLQVDVLMHHMEVWRPSSTGHLIHRTVAGAGLHVYRRERGIEPAAMFRPDRTLWILHPLGEPLPSVPPPAAALQVLLLDGTWRQAGDMARALEPWGRRVRLPMAGESRYWLRAQAGENKFSTIEALLFLLAALGLPDVHEQLRRQFELHVYAGLRARGGKAAAAEFLKTSPVPAAFPEVLAEFEVRRPRP